MQAAAEQVETLATAGGAGDISTHVISKLGPDSVAGARVVLHFNPDVNACCFDAGWVPVCDEALSANGGHDVSTPRLTSDRFAAHCCWCTADTRAARTVAAWIVHVDL